MRCGVVAIVGKPNVGKSTLLNALIGTKVAPVSPKPQTTRKGVRGIFTSPSGQIIFVDTPGLHRSQDALDQFMNDEAVRALAEVDAVLWVVDLRLPPGDEDKMVARALNTLPAPLHLIGNKLDAAKYPQEAIDLYAGLLDREHRRWSLSAEQGPQAVEPLRAALLAELPEGPLLYPGSPGSDQTREFWAAELIREAAMRQLRDELPYGIAARVTRWEEREDGLQKIYATIFVERTNHKGMVIGKGGRQIGSIGQAARKQLEVFLAKKVYLELQVEVLPSWRSDPEALRELGYA
jgi:GTP-binding protein Era